MRQEAKFALVRLENNLVLAAANLSQLKQELKDEKTPAARFSQDVQQAGFDSIEHWKRMRDDPKCCEIPDGKHCPLCQMFFNSGDGYCTKCPISISTKLSLCNDTPYRTALFVWRTWANAERPMRGLTYDAWHYAATQMIEFLEKIFLGEVK